MQTTTRTMTEAQMSWNLKQGFAWFDVDANGEPMDDWRSIIWTKAGGWVWNTPTIEDKNGHYSLEV